MRTTAVAGFLGATLLVAAAGAARGDSGPGWVDVEVDGTTQRAPVRAVEGTEERQEPGDVMYVDGYLLPRGPEPRPRFRTAPGRLVLLAEDGSETVVAATAVAAGAAPESPSDDPAVDGIRVLSDRELASLRGVRLVGWSADLEDTLARAGGGRLTILVTSRDEDASIPPLPAATRALAFRLGWVVTSQGPSDLSPLARLSGLRCLDLGYRFRFTTDLSPLKGLANLRRLDLGCRRVAQAGTLGALVALRHLDLASAEGIGDLQFARTLQALRTIRVDYTRVSDLSPLAALPDVEHVGATSTPVRALPEGPWPSLRHLDMLCTAVPRGEVEAFRAAHPACTVLHDRRSLLLEALAGVDRVRVRTGGTCHRRPDDETTIAELTRADEITALLNAIQIDEPGDPGSCMCCGNPTFEFYVGEELKASLGYHHGLNLRWAGGEWPNDAPLTAEAQDRLASWLADRGVTDPAEELAAQRKAAAAARLRLERWTSLLGEDTLAAVTAATEEEEGDAVEKVLRILVGKVPDPTARALLAFRLLGTAGTEWTELSAAARKLLAGVEADTVLAAVERAFADDEGAFGVACWLFAASPVRVEGVGPWVARAAGRALARSEPDDRALAIQGLRGYPAPDSVALLRRVLGGTVLPAADASDADEPPAETMRNLERACESLLALGDAESIPRMRAVAVAWSADERSRLEEGIRTLLAKSEDKAPGTK